MQDLRAKSIGKAGMTHCETYLKMMPPPWNLLAALYYLGRIDLLDESAVSVSRQRAFQSSSPYSEDLCILAEF